MLILYTTEDGKSQIQLRAEERTVWLTQLEMAELFATSLSSLDGLIAAQSEKLEALKTHKKGIIQQLFPSPTVAEA